MRIITPKWIGLAFGILLVLSFLSLNVNAVQEKVMDFGDGTGTGSIFFTYATQLQYTSVNFTANASFDLEKIVFYVATVNLPTTDKFVIAIFNVNSTGGFGSQVGGNSTEHLGIATNNDYEVTWSSNYPNINNGNKYWITFMPTEVQAKNTYFRIGVGGTTTGNYYWVAGNNLQEDWGATGELTAINIKLWGTVTSSSSLIESVNYTTPIVSDSQTTIYFNITNATFPPQSNTLTQANVTLNYYNGSKYQMNLLYSNDTSAGFYYIINSPTVTSNTIASFNFSYFANNIPFNSSNYQQTIFTIPALVVSSTPCTTLSYKFTFYDEDNSTLLNMTTINYIFKDGLSNNTLQTTSGSFNDISSFYVCINDSISPTYYLGYSQINYQKTGWVARRWYGFVNSTLTAVTKNVSLYDLNNANAQTFQIIVRGADGTIYANKYIALIRWYPSINTYSPVDWGITDSTGSTVTYVRPTDTDYRVGVYEPNGTLIYLASPIRFICISSPCTYSLTVNPNLVVYNSLYTLQFTDIFFNKLTNIWSWSYSDSSMLVQTMNLTIFEDTGSEYFSICTNIVTGSAGALTCNTSDYAGWNTTMVGIVTRESPLPRITIIKKIITTLDRGISNTFGLFLSILLIIPIVFVFAMISPVGAIFGGLIALLPAMILGSVSWTVFGAFAVICGIIMHLINKRVS